MGLIKLFLNMADRKKVDFGDLFRGAKSFKHYLLYLGTYILMSLILGIPTIILAAIGFYALNAQTFLIVPVILIIFSLVVGSLIQFANLFSLENRYHLIKAIKKSYEMTKNDIVKLIGALILIALMNVLGALPFMLGLLITVPLSTLVYVHIYRSLDPEIKIAQIKEDGGGTLEK